MTSTTKSMPNPKALLAALLFAAAAFHPESSAAAAPSQLVYTTCSRTSTPRLCIDLLQSSNRSAAATSVRDLAVVAVTAARRSVLRARVRMVDQVRGATGRPAASVARCSGLYWDCLRAGAWAVGMASTMPGYEYRTADAVSALRMFPEKCEELFRDARVASPLVKVNREVEEKIGVAAEILRLSR